MCIAHACFSHIPNHAPGLLSDLALYTVVLPLACQAMKTDQTRNTYSTSGFSGLPVAVWPPAACWSMPTRFLHITSRRNEPATCQQRTGPNAATMRLLNGRKREHEASTKNRAVVHQAAPPSSAHPVVPTICSALHNKAAHRASHACVANMRT